MSRWEHSFLTSEFFTVEFPYLFIFLQFVNLLALTDVRHHIKYLLFSRSNLEIGVWNSHPGPWFPSLPLTIHLGSWNSFEFLYERLWKVQMHVRPEEFGFLEFGTEGSVVWLPWGGGLFIRLENCSIRCWEMDSGRHFMSFIFIYQSVYVNTLWCGWIMSCWVHIRIITLF